MFCYYFDDHKSACPPALVHKELPVLDLQGLVSLPPRGQAVLDKTESNKSIEILLFIFNMLHMVNCMSIFTRPTFYVTYCNEDATS